VLEGAAGQTGESPSCFVRDGDSRLWLAASERPAGPARHRAPWGRCCPSTVGSGGKVLLALADDGRGPLPRVDAAELETILRRGWAQCGRTEGGWQCQRPHPRLGGRIHAAVGVSGPVNRLGRQPGKRLAGPVMPPPGS